MFVQTSDDQSKSSQSARKRGRRWRIPSFTFFSPLGGFRASLCCWVGIKTHKKFPNVDLLARLLVWPYRRVSFGDEV